MSVEKVSVSSAFKDQTRNAILAIILFVVAYLLLLVLAIAFTLACVAGGVFLISTGSVFAILLGIGLMSLGVLVLSVSYTHLTLPTICSV